MEFDKHIFGELIPNVDYSKKSDEFELEGQKAHLRFLTDLRDKGLLLCADPFEGGGGILFFDDSKTSIDELKEICNQDPHVIAGRHSLRFKILYTKNGNLQFKRLEAPS